MKKIVQSTALAAAVLACAHPAWALDTMPGDAMAPPVGTTLAGIYYIRNTLPEFYVDGKLVSGPKANVDVGVLRVLHPMKIGGYQVNPQFALPFGQVAGAGTLSSAPHTSGLGDLSVSASVMLKQDPATRTSVYILPGLTWPTGAYDKTKINLSEHRRSMFLQVGGQTALDAQWTLDAYADATWYGSNTDNVGGTLDQAAKYELQSFLRYALSGASELSAGVRYNNGGASKVAGVSQKDAFNKTTLLVGGSSWVAPGVLLNGYLGRDTSVNNGFKASSIVELRLAKVF